ncbi:MAG: hypothetical protein E6Q36_01240 [Chryseobacterium sp.]|nr:MAG: hypothetical protein E6Q36_01240 [Chryseobacterium sp.]
MTILFMYKAALYCEDCGKRLRADLDKQGKKPADPNDETSYDSDDYPKECLSGESDTIDFCDSGERCTDPLELKNGFKVGCYLDQDLTDQGVVSLRESLAEKDLDPVLRRTYEKIAKSLYVKYDSPAIREAKDEHGKLPQYSSVGGYTIGYYSDSGDMFCADCAADPDNEVSEIDAYFEGPTVHCDGCNAEIESAYGDPDAEESEE